MKREGQIVITAFPSTDLATAKLRPVLTLKRASDRFDDWLVCMVSSQLAQAESDFDEIIRPDDSDFLNSGLKVSSVFRLKRLAVLNNAVLIGAIGELDESRVQHMQRRLAEWIRAPDQ